ncbi:preprotein translocase subunit SecD [Sulfobacillus acidophilus TPY]|uniref:Protein translocase subunit SecD n=1 Tax=Sulfobacillus acidophilus (strain ATCC 700253 / DSM 10332 / NAL) TaxID=679936 RepID=G8TXS7_SULAD|nr:preprotein translocase subunit SecD [Sulfobacillus acidophilus TPY]AEW05033.1 protein-export membrane protein SecD [Sulfobacillus acidophilus DSM 10332]MCY0865033.1 protein translocase subunit SecD [Sulfobacillus sp.]
MRQRSLVTLVVLVAMIIVAGYYFAVQNPITNHLKYGLDLKGGVTALYQAEPSPGAPVNANTMAKAIQILSYRINKLGVSEPVIQQVGSNRIMVQLPGVKNPEQALQYLGQTALLQIKSPTGQVLLTGSDLSNAVAAISQGQYVVDLTFDAKGTQLFKDATTKYLGNILPIYLDGKLLEAPKVDSVIPNGQAELTGGFATLKQAQQMALLLQSGALPVNLKVLSVQTVSATLGHASIVASKQAAAIAIILIALFMVFWYRLAGLFADIALSVYMFLLLGALWAIHATVTVPGIAGMILSVGMAVDANVIIFSRVREEMLAGKTPRAAIEAGFRNAIRAILDSNATTFISALILFFLGSGEVKGFALTLMIGIVISLFTAVIVTREFIRLAADAGWARVRAVFLG